MAFENPWLWSPTKASNTSINGNTTDPDTATPAILDDWQTENMSQIAKLLDDFGAVNTVGGTANAITITSAVTITALATGLIIAFKAGSANTGAATVNVDSLGVKAIRQQGDSALIAGQIAADGVYILRYDAGYNSSAGAWVLLNPSQVVRDYYVQLTDTKSAGTAGGTFTAGSWATRTLNTEDSDTESLCTLSSNQFTLTAGTYRILATAPAIAVDRHQARLYNATDGSLVLAGTSEDTGGSDTVTTRSRITGVFTIGASKALEIQHQCSTTQATNGFGQQANFGISEIYTTVELWKIA